MSLFIKGRSTRLNGGEGLNYDFKALSVKEKQLKKSFPKTSDHIRKINLLWAQKKLPCKEKFSEIFWNKHTLYFMLN